ncbi:unnamed protein product [Rhizoctonia solani]|uniref:RGS domain-containing protein n=1 Tax=Rhizoctonia solani TaxID=456999 RepID=A0A8H2WCU3_9AGAM|nr:unnamed protein product [Rhizoctonia solani]
MAPNHQLRATDGITVVPRQSSGPDYADIPLSDLSGHLGPATGHGGDVPEWERIELPFNLPVIAPSTSNQQPESWSPNPMDIKHFPSRLKNAPPRPRGVPLKKRFAIIPEYDIPLSEIMDDLHASPLSLREFEEYLLYVERTVENLYFCLWLKQYTQTYRDWERRHPVPPSDSDFGNPSTSVFKRPTDRDRTQSINVPLANSFQHAKHLFFDPSSQYELNVTEDMIDPIRQWVKPPKKSTSGKKSRRKEAWEESPETEPEPEVQEISFVHPHPDAFQRVLTEIEGTLRQSLTRFFQLSFTNSGRSHDKIGYGVWFVYIMATVAASVSLIMTHKPRPLRLVVAPLLLVAWSIGLSTYNGICPAIFAFGDSRQMYPYEIFIFKCRVFVQNPHDPNHIDWKYMSSSNKGADSADPIIRPKRAHRPRKPSRLPAVRRLLGAKGRRNRRPQSRSDLECGRPEGTGFGFRVEAEPEQERSFGNLQESLDPVTPLPTPPPVAYIPGGDSTLSVHRLGEQMHKHPWTPTSAAYGGFDIYALRTQPSPHPHCNIPRRASEHSDSSPRSCETEVELPDQDELARSLNLDLGDPRALGLYGHMVTIPNPIVRHVHREIFVRSWWMAVAVTIPIMVILLVIP